MKVGHSLKESRPVLLDLLSTSKAPIRVHGLLAPVVRIEAGEESPQVVLVHCLAEALDDICRCHRLVRALANLHEHRFVTAAPAG